MVRLDTGLLVLHPNVLGASAWIQACALHLPLQAPRIDTERLEPANTLSELIVGNPERIESLLYDGAKLNSVFPFSCDALPETGNFAVILLAQDLDQISYLKESLKEMGVTR